MTNYFSGFHPMEGAAGAKGSAAFLGAISTAIIYLYRRSASVLTDADKPNGSVVYTFATNNINLTAVTNGWQTTIPSGSNPLYVVAATATSTDPTDTILSNEWTTPSILAQNGTAGTNSATVFLFQRSNSSTPPAVPSTNTTYTFATGILAGTLGSWSQTAPDSAGGKYLFVTTATAISTGPDDIILPGEWATVRVIAQDGNNGSPGSPGSPGTAAISGYVTNDSINLTAYADGNVISYSTATGEFKIFSGQTDISTSFTLSTLSNPQTLTVGYSGRIYNITGGFDANEDNATLTIRATGSGTYAGVIVDKIITFSKSKGGYEIVSALPSTNLFEGRIVYLSTDGQVYKYRGGSWKSITDASEIVGLVKSSQIDAGYGQNLVTNPRGQDGTAGWALHESTNLGTYLFIQNTSWFGSGRFGFNIQSKSSPNVGVGICCRAFPVVPGRVYSVRWRHGSNLPGGGGYGNYVRMLWATNRPASGFVDVGTARDGMTPLVTEGGPFPGSETEVSTSWTAPPGANWASISFYNWSTPVSVDYYFSEVEVVEQITTSKLPMGVGANLLVGAVPGTNPQRYIWPSWNPDNATFLDMGTGATVGAVRTIVGDPISAWESGLESWKMSDNSNFVIKQLSNGLTPSSYVTDFLFDRVIDTSGNTDWRVPIEPNKYYEGSVYLGPHRCSVWLFILWYDSALQQIGPTAIINSGLAYLNQDTQGSMGGAQLSNYTRLVARGQAPSNARYAALVIRKGATAGAASNSYLFGTRPMLAETTPNPSLPLPYSPPPPALFHAESLISNTVDTRHLRANSVKSNTVDAYAITATKLALTSPDDMFPDPQFRDLAWWNMADIPSYSANNGAAVANQPLRFARCSVGSADRVSLPVPVEAGAWIRTKLRIWISSDAQGWWGCTQHWPNQAWYPGGGSRTYRGDIDAGGYPIIDLATTSIPKGQWVTLTSLDQFHPGTAYNGQDHYMQQRTRYNITQGFVEYAFETVRANNAELIVDGSITANKIFVPDLSAIKADVGVLTAGTIRNAADTYNMDITNGRTVARTGAWMKVTGAPFGSSNQFIEWYGPYNANLATCTEANARYYLRTDGSAYFGGALSAGTLRNAATTSSIASNASIDLGQFGSNGGSITVTVSYFMSSSYTVVYPADSTGLSNYESAVAGWGTTNSTASGNTGSKSVSGTVAVELRRGVNGGGLSTVTTLSISSGTEDLVGVRPVVGDSQGSITYTRTFSGSLTYTDPQTIAQNRQYAAFLTARTGVSLGSNESQRISLGTVEQ